MKSFILWLIISCMGVFNPCECEVVSDAPIPYEDVLITEDAPNPYEDEWIVEDAPDPFEDVWIVEDADDPFA